MPRGDGTGPMGAGPMTGWANGWCNRSTASGATGVYAGRGQGGFGRGCLPLGGGFGGGRRGNRNMVQPAGGSGRLRFSGYGRTPIQSDPEQEKMFLKNQAEALQAQLDSVAQRLQSLETGQGEK